MSPDSLTSELSDKVTPLSILERQELHEKAWDGALGKHLEETFNSTWKYAGSAFMDWEVYNAGKEGGYLSLSAETWMPAMMDTFPCFQTPLMAGAV